MGDEVQPVLGGVEVQEKALHVCKKMARALDIPVASIATTHLLANKKNRKYYDVDQCRHVYGMLLARSGLGRRKRGVSKEVARLYECRVRVVQTIWNQGREGGSVNAVMDMRMLKSGRSKVMLNADAIEAIPHEERTTLRCLAVALNMKRSTVHCRLKETKFCRHTSDLKPSLNVDNMKACVLYSLMHLEPSSLPHKPTFKAGYNVVHIDEKWFYQTRKNQKLYLRNKEPNPQRQGKEP
ncbi:hypothetical protein D1007_34766 [Hordeum vulgare]|nr:hypothetical protein D1007_34766 [Hordeum vulgare]